MIQLTEFLIKMIYDLSNTYSYEIILLRKNPDLDLYRSNAYNWNIIHSSSKHVVNDDVRKRLQDLNIMNNYIMAIVLRKKFMSEAAGWDHINIKKYFLLTANSSVERSIDVYLIDNKMEIRPKYHGHIKYFDLFDPNSINEICEYLTELLK